MANQREPQQIAKRAIILGTLALRSSLEITLDPGVPATSKRLLPWLIDIGCENELDPIERQEFETPLGKLNDSQMMDIRWASVAASFFCWMLKLREGFGGTARENPNDLFRLLGVLKPQATDIIQSASLRDRPEIVTACLHVIFIRSMLLEARADAKGREIIRRINTEKLMAAGYPITEDVVQRASEAIQKMTPEERKRAAAFYFVRHLAAMWYLTDLPTYYASSRK